MRKNDQHSKIYLPCNFEVNLIAHLGVIECWLVHSITEHNFETRHPSDDSDQFWFPLV
jgi:hypothetical protein